MSRPLISPNETRLRVIVERVRQALQGRLNIAGTFRLSSGSTTTAVSDNRMTSGSLVLLQPLTASANTALSGGDVRVSSQTSSGFKVSHDSSTTSDREFRYGVLG